MTTIQFLSLPEQLKEHPHFLLWKSVLKEGQPKPSKVPVSPKTLNACNPTDLGNCVSFDEAISALTSNQDHSGLGFSLSQNVGITCIDLDGCLNSEGQLKDWAKPIFEKLPPTYVEVSQSGEGLHLFFKAVLPGGRKKVALPDGNHLEAYDRSRYIAVTGIHFTGSLETIAKAQAEVEAFYWEYFPKDGPVVNPSVLPKTPVNLDDQALLELMMSNAKTGKRIEALWHGDISQHADDSSAADMALMNDLAFWTNLEPIRMERLFGMSALGQRPKWQERPDYRQRTIDEALKATSRGYSPSHYHVELPDDEVISDGNVSLPSTTAEESPTASDNSPIPLRSTLETEYPVWALGPILGPAVLASYEAIQAPLPICAMSFLAAASLAVQAHGNVERDGDLKPVSLFLMSVANSSDRKTSVDKAALRPHREHEASMFRGYKADMATYRIALETWTMSRTRILKGQDEVKRNAELRSLGPPPREPLNPVFLSDEPTVEGLMKLFDVGRGSFGLFNDEGGRVFGGHSMQREHQMKYICTLSQMFDGTPIKDIRKGHDVKFFNNKRLAAHLMVQPVIFNELLKNTLMLQQGILARFLITWSDTLAGTRFYKPVNLYEHPDYVAYADAMTKILKTPYPVVDDDQGQSELAPKTLKLSDEAMVLWVEFYNHVEKEQADDGYFEAIRPFAGKSGEFVSRIAGTLALVDDLETLVIHARYVEASIAIVQFHLLQALRFYDSQCSPLKLASAEKLLKWVQKNYAVGETISLTEIYQRGPRAVRNKDSALAAVQELEAKGWLRQITKPKPKDAWELRG
jgi:hypothetical protein